MASSGLVGGRGGKAHTAFQGQSAAWSHDSYGNRTAQTFSNGLHSNWANYNPANNQITTATAGTYVYDASGNTLYDGNHEYWYDAEGQLCAVAPINANGYPIAPYTSYIYDAEGARIGKGTLSAAPPNSTSLCATPLSSGFTLSARYLVDQGGNQVTELSEQGMPTAATEIWKHSNVFSAARLTATYDTLGLHYELADPLGTKRVQANISGQIEMSWISLPFGDALTPILPTNPPSTADDATEHHFTQKERDSESNNDYFFARYYNSAIGRFTTPDWSAKVVPVPYAKLSDPQSLNLYAYVGNNPMTRIDSDGHGCITIFGKLICIGDPPPLPPPLPPPPPPVAPTANLHTSMSNNTTTFVSTNVYGQTKIVQIETRTEVDSKASPGAGEPFSTPNIGQAGNNPAGNTDAQGPREAYINTGDTANAHPGDDHSGRNVHGGGTGSPDPQGPVQGKWIPTYGCTRGMNRDVIMMVRSINESRSDATESPVIPYDKTRE